MLDAWIMIDGSWLIAKGGQPGGAGTRARTWAARALAPGLGRAFLALSNGPRPLSHDLWTIKHASSIKLSSYDDMKPSSYQARIKLPSCKVATMAGRQPFGYQSSSRKVFWMLIKAANGFKGFSQIDANMWTHVCVNIEIDVNHWTEVWVETKIGQSFRTNVRVATKTSVGVWTNVWVTNDLDAFLDQGSSNIRNRCNLLKIE